MVIIDGETEYNSNCDVSDAQNTIATIESKQHRVESRITIEKPTMELSQLPNSVQLFIKEYVAMCSPAALQICDGSDFEAKKLTESLLDAGTLVSLSGMDNCYLARTDPRDVARVEGKTYLVTRDRKRSVPPTKEGVKGIMGQWMKPEDMNKAMNDRFPGCMEGRTMYVIPFCMGPLGSPLSKIGVQLTDSAYVVLSMRIMTRVSNSIWRMIAQGDDYVPCVHSVGVPVGQESEVAHWPCRPDQTLVAHFPLERRILSFGSGYGGNSLLGKKCFALRIASNIARDEGWLAEHMLIMGVKDPTGEERFIAAAFPSACGKTNMAMLKPSLPGWKVRCIGDDIAWLKFNEKGELRAINPEAGFFGVAPGTNKRTNPVAMETIKKNTIYTNVAQTSSGGVFWEGLEDEIDSSEDITSWRGESWKIGDDGKAAHPNSRFCTPAAQCPTIHPRWEDPAGVPISAIVFGGRRPEGIPLVYEAFNWRHGVMVGAALKSETTAAAEFTGKQIMHDPMAMRPFMGYNFGHYLQHWLDMEKPNRKMPKVFHVNWFRLDSRGRFVWPGFGENIRVIDWILRRTSGTENGVKVSPLGLLPTESSINLKGLDVNAKELFDLPRDYLMEDILETKDFLDAQVGSDLPEKIQIQLENQIDRIEMMNKGSTPC